MRPVSAQWFECKVAFDKIMEDGLQKTVTEKYVVNAMSHSEAEELITKEMKPYISGEFDVKGIVPAAYKEVLFTDNTTDARWYKAKVAFLTIDEKTEKEKRFIVTYLVQAASVHNAADNIDSVLGKGMTDYEIISIAEQPAILDVFEYKGTEGDNKESDKG